MMTQPMASPDDIDISAVFSAIWRNLVRVLGFAALAGIVVYGLVALVAPRYESEAALEVVARDGSNPFVDPRTDGASPDVLSVRMDKQAVNTHVRAIQSSEIAAKISEQLGLAGLREFNGALGPVDTMDAILRMVGIGGPRPGESEEDRVLDAYYDKLTVSSPPESRVIAISFQSHDPELAATIANTLAETYRQRLASVTVVETDELQQALAPKIKALGAEVAEAEAAVGQFRASAGLLRGGSQKTPLNDQQLGDLTTELTKASAARSGAETRARNARQLMRKGTPEVIPEVQRSPLIQNLIQQKVQVQRDLLKYSASMKSAHPVIKQLDADLLAIRRQIGAEVANVVASLEKEALVAAEQENEIRKSLDTVKARVADTGGDQVKLRQLEAVANSKRAELERLQAQFEANRARADRGVVPVEARIITRARPSSVPVAPKKAAWAALSAVAALLLGLAIVVTRALFTAARPQRRAVVRAEPAFVPEETIAPASRMTATGDAPALNANAPSAVGARQAPGPLAAAAARANAEPLGTPSPRLAGQRPAMPAAEDAATTKSPHELADRLMALSTQGEVGVRSLVAIEGPKTLACEQVLRTALAMSEAGANVLLIDWNLDGKGISDELGLPTRPGFLELFRGTASFETVVKVVPGTRIQAIASGAAFAEGVNGLDSDQLNLLLDALDEAYDQIVVVAARWHARALFETIQGRFDAGVTLTVGAPDVIDENDTFLGFQVADIELLRLVVPKPRTPVDVIGGSRRREAPGTVRSATAG